MQNTQLCSRRGDSILLLQSCCLLDCRRLDLPTASDVQKCQCTLSSSGPIQHNSRTLGFILHWMHNSKHTKILFQNPQLYKETVFYTGIFYICKMYGIKLFQRILLPESTQKGSINYSNLMESQAEAVRDKTHHWWGQQCLCVSTQPPMTWSHTTLFWHELSFTPCTRRIMPVEGAATWSYGFSSLLHLWPFCTLLILLWRVIYLHTGFSEVPLSKALDCFAKTNYFGQHFSQKVDSFSKCWVQE